MSIQHKNNYLTLESLNDNLQFDRKTLRLVSFISKSAPNQEFISFSEKHPAFVVGYFLGGKDGGTKSVLGLGTAQRNLSAALVVAGQNFADDPNVLSMILVAGLVGLVLLMFIGGELGRRAGEPETAPSS